MLADVISVGYVGSLSGSRADYPNAISVDVTSDVLPSSQSALRVNVL